MHLPVRIDRLLALLALAILFVGFAIGLGVGYLLMREQVSQARTATGQARQATRYLQQLSGADFGSLERPAAISSPAVSAAVAVPAVPSGITSLASAAGKRLVVAQPKAPTKPVQPEAVSNGIRESIEPVSQQHPVPAQTVQAASSPEVPPPIPTVRVAPEVAGIAKITTNSVRFASGREIILNEVFPSGEVLLKVDPARNEILTSKRRIVLEAGRSTDGH